MRKTLQRLTIPLAPFSATHEHDGSRRSIRRPRCCGTTRQRIGCESEGNDVVTFKVKAAVQPFRSTSCGSSCSRWWRPPRSRCRVPTGVRNAGRAGCVGSCRSTRHRLPECCFARRAECSRLAESMRAHTSWWPRSDRSDLPCGLHEQLGKNTKVRPGGRCQRVSSAMLASRHSLDCSQRFSTHLFFPRYRTAASLRKL